jgi:type IV pilus assembly protein PilA
MIRSIRKRGFTLIELMIVVAIIGILAAIAIPNFIRFQARSKQGEAKSNLKSLFTAERSYYQEKDKYVNTINDIGFGPERANRYAYMNAAACTWQARTAVNLVPSALDTCISVDTFKYTAAVSTPTFSGTAPTWSTVSTAPLFPGTAGSCPNCNFAGTAAGNIDTETQGIDSWYISSLDGTDAAVCGNSDTSAPAGAPFNTYNDVTCDT